MNVATMIELEPPVLEGELTERRKTVFVTHGRKVVASVRSNFLVLDTIRENRKVSKALGKHKVSTAKPTTGMPTRVFSHRARVINLEGAVVERADNNTTSLRVTFLTKGGSKLDSVVLLCGSEEEAAHWQAMLQAQTTQRAVTNADFEPLFLLGKGHFGRVQLVQHRHTGALLALKEVKEERVALRRSSGSSGLGSPKAGTGLLSSKATKSSKKSISEMRFEKQISERLLLAELGNNPFMARLAFAFRENGKLFFASEFSERGDLWTMIRAKKRVGLAAARFLTAEAVAAVASLHAKGILHRDIKLENIMLDSRGHVKLIDLGLSKRLTERPSSTLERRRFGYTFSLCGTSYYQPPELVSGVGHRFPVDWWQVGCLLYELIVGKPAFFDKTPKLVHAKILSLDGPNMSHFAKLAGSDAEAFHAHELVTALLTHDQSERLGALGAEQVMDHPFFKSVDWNVARSRQIAPPDEIVQYVAAPEPAPEDGPIRADVVARYFRDARTLTGQSLNDKVSADRTDASSWQEARRKALEGSAGSSASSADNRVSTNMQSSSVSESLNDSDRSDKLRRRPTLPVRQESFGPHLGFAYRAPQPVLAALLSERRASSGSVSN